MPQTHLLRRNGRYYFRLRVPLDIQPWFAGRGEIKKSLRTANWAAARSLARVQSFQAEKVFTLIRSGAMTEEQIRRLVDDYTEQTLRETEEARAQGGFLPSDREDLGDMLETHSFLLEGAKEALAMGNIKEVEHVAQHLIQEKSLPLLAGSPEFRLLCRELLKMSVFVQAIEMARLGGNYDNRFDRRYSLPPPVQPEIGQGKAESLSKLIKEYVEETAGSGRWIPKSRAEAEAIYTLFLRIVGDRDVRTLSHRVVVEYRETLRRLPSNMNKSPRFRGKSISELLAMKVEKPLSETSVNKHITLVGAFLKWAVRQSYVETNYVEGLTIARKAAKESEEREAYSSDDIGKLLANPLYGDTPRARGSYQKHPEHYWIPLIGLFSGMRLNEICQLHVEDIEEIDGVVCFSINAEGTRKLKNIASRRVIPVHPQLIRLGLVRYVSRVKGEGDLRLWMNLKGKRDGHAQDMSKWYQRFNRKNITTNPKKVFHSFRHCVADNLKQRKVEGSIISELLGHSQASITLSRYGKSYEPRVLLEALTTLDYGVGDALARVPLFEP